MGCRFPAPTIESPQSLGGSRRGREEEEGPQECGPLCAPASPVPHAALLSARPPRRPLTHPSPSTAASSRILSSLISPDGHPLAPLCRPRAPWAYHAPSPGHTARGPAWGPLNLVWVGPPDSCLLQLRARGARACSSGRGLGLGSGLGGDSSIEHRCQASWSWIGQNLLTSAQWWGGRGRRRKVHPGALEAGAMAPRSTGLEPGWSLFSALWRGPRVHRP